MVEDRIPRDYIAACVRNINKVRGYVKLLPAPRLPGRRKELRFQGDRRRKQDIILQMDVLMQITLKFAEFLIRHPVCRTPVRRRRVGRG